MSSVYSVIPDDAETGRVRIAIENQSGVVVGIKAHHSAGGIEDVGCSGEYFLASLAGCYEITLRLVAAASRLTVHRLDLRIETDWDARERWDSTGMYRLVSAAFGSWSTSTRMVLRSGSRSWASCSVWCPQRSSVHLFVIAACCFPSMSDRRWPLASPDRYLGA